MPEVHMFQLDWNELNAVTALVRMLLAMLLGGFLGTEREHKHRPAGLRTYMIVCLASALVMLTGEFIFEKYGTGDPTRLAAQVISGIGFLGAGTIIVTSRQVIGLTTAAGLWASACIGLAAGAGYYLGAVLCGVMVMVIMTVFRLLGRKLMSKGNALHLFAVFECMGDFYHFVSEIQRQGYQLFEVEFTQTSRREEGPVFLNFGVRLPAQERDRERALEQLRSSASIKCLEKAEMF